MKTNRFWGYPKPYLCLVFCVLTSCKVQAPVEKRPVSAYQAWTIEAQIGPGIRAEQLTLSKGADLSPVIFILNSNIRSPDSDPIAVIYHAVNCQAAQQIREQLLATGFVQNLKITH